MINGEENSTREIETIVSFIAKVRVGDSTPWERAALDFVKSWHAKDKGCVGLIIYDRKAIGWSNLAYRSHEFGHFLPYPTKEDLHL